MKRSSISLSTKSRPAILLTAGPTRAYLDDVRFLSNYSSGELGFEICRALLQKDFDVLLVLGPTATDFSSLALKEFVSVETVSEMQESVETLCRKYKPDYAVFSAAVLDFEPKTRLRGKVTSKNSWVIELKPTPKIIDSVGKKFPKICRVGFKLEPGKAPSLSKRDRYAKDILAQKSLEMLCINYLGEIGNGKHRAFLYKRAQRTVTLNSKKQIAREIATSIRQALDLKEKG